jgi:hypothetical protein
VRLKDGVRPAEPERVSDSGSIVIGWLTRLVALFALLGFLAYDGFMVVQANVGASDDASTAARAAADAFAGTKNVQTAYNAAANAVAEKHDVVETKNFSIDSTGTVTLTVDRTATTLWMHRLGPLKKWTEVRQTGSGTPPS